MQFRVPGIRDRSSLRRSTGKADRRAMLQGVYEDNLRAAGKSFPKPAGERRVRASFKWTSGLLVCVFFIAAGVLARAGGGEPDSVAASFQISRPSADSIARPVPAASVNTSEPDGARPPVADLYGLELQTIVIDAGHGGRDPGAVGQHGLHEKDVTLDLAQRLKARLEQYPGYRVLLTRDGDESRSLRERIQFANEHDADLFISLHVNSLPDNSVAPVETYYYGPGSDTRANRLAERENQNSGFSLAEFRDLTQQLGLELKIEESRKVAHSIQEGLYRNMRGLHAEISDWGAKTGDFMVLLGVEAPSVLVEVSSISHSAQERLLSTTPYREQLALFLEDALVDYLRQHAQGKEAYASEEIEGGI